MIEFKKYEDNFTVGFLGTFATDKEAKELVKLAKSSVYRRYCKIEDYNIWLRATNEKIKIIEESYELWKEYLSECKPCLQFEV